MTLREHESWKRHWLREAKKGVKDRDWLFASNCYRSAAFHAHILKTLKERPKRRKSAA